MLHPSEIYNLNISLDKLKKSLNKFEENQGIQINENDFYYASQNSYYSRDYINKKYADHINNWNHIKSTNILHPAAFPDLATKLNITQNELCDLLHYSSHWENEKPTKVPFYELNQKLSGLKIIEEKLGEDFKKLPIINQIPIPPLEFRKFIDFEGIPGTPDIASILFQKAMRYGYWLEGDYETIAYYVHSSYQQIFELLIVSYDLSINQDNWKLREEHNRLFGSESFPSYASFIEEVTPQHVYIVNEEHIDEEDHFLHYHSSYIHKNKLLLQNTSQLKTINLSNGTIEDSIDLKDSYFFSTKKPNLLIQYDHESYQQTLKSYDFETKKLSNISEKDLPIYYVESGESALLIDPKKGSSINLESGDYPIKVVKSVCGEYILIHDKHCGGGGGIYHIKTAFSHFNIDLYTNYFDDDEVHEEDEDENYDEDIYQGIVLSENSIRKYSEDVSEIEHYLGALAKVNDQFFYFDGQSVFYGNKRLFQLNFKIHYTVLNLELDLLIIGNEKELVKICFSELLKKKLVFDVVSIKS